MLLTVKTGIPLYPPGTFRAATAGTEQVENKPYMPEAASFKYEILKDRLIILIRKETGTRSSSTCP